LCTCRNHHQLGPYIFRKVDEAKGNITIEIAPGKFHTTKHKDLRRAKEQKEPDWTGRIVPEKLNEIVVISSFEEIEKIKKKSFQGQSFDSKKDTPQSLVGKRITIYWGTGPYKGWHKGTVVGYTSNLKHSLIYYDVRNDEVDPRVDYYAQNLFSGKTKWNFI
jgi:hypothetical protein